MRSLLQEGHANVKWLVEAGLTGLTEREYRFLILGHSRDDCDSCVLWNAGKGHRGSVEEKMEKQQRLNCALQST
jgi:hypothetical protein